MNLACCVAFQRQPVSLLLCQWIANLSQDWNVAYKLTERACCQKSAIARLDPGWNRWLLSVSSITFCLKNQTMAALYHAIYNSKRFIFYAENVNRLPIPNCRIYRLKAVGYWFSSNNRSIIFFFLAKIIVEICRSETFENGLKGHWILSEFLDW